MRELVQRNYHILYEAKLGKQYKDIAKEFGISPQMVYKIVKRYGFRKRFYRKPKTSFLSRKRNLTFPHCFVSPNGKLEFRSR